MTNKPKRGWSSAVCTVRNVPDDRVGKRQSPRDIHARRIRWKFGLSERRARLIADLRFGEGPVMARKPYKHQKRGAGRWVQLPEYLQASEAWASLKPGPRALYVEMKWR